MEKRKRGTIIDRAKAEVSGFPTMFSRLEQKVVLGGLSESTLKNYGRCIARNSSEDFLCICYLEDLPKSGITGYYQANARRPFFQTLVNNPCLSPIGNLSGNGGD